MNAQTRWGWIVYAPTNAGHRVVDALSAALLAKSNKLARELRIRHNRIDVETLDFHTTSWHGAGPNSWLPQLGEIVEVHLNSDRKLVSVWYVR